jgi:hypothetical protein
MISVHWIPTHRSADDRERFARWKPPFVKIVCIDEKPPYLEDVPQSALIVIRNHPMSELYGARGLAAGPSTKLNAVEPSTPSTKLNAVEPSTAYVAYFASIQDARYCWRGQCTDRPGFAQASTAGAPATSSASDSPEVIGAAHAATCDRMAAYAETKGVSRQRLLFEGLNEPQLWAAEPPALTARYYHSFLTRLHTYGLHGVVGNLGVGWPGNGGVAEAPPQWSFFNPVIAAMQPGDYLGLHEYWALDGPRQNWRWWAGRFAQCPYKVPILVTECGIDTGVTGAFYGGWSDLPGTVDQKAARYCDELWDYAGLCAADPRVRGIFPFTYDIGGKEWEKFDIRGDPFVEAFFHKLAVAGMPKPLLPDPPPTPPPTPAATLAQLRDEAWKHLNIPYNPEAALARFARNSQLGNPLTPEFDLGPYRAQGFAARIVYCTAGDWANCKTLEW